VPDVEEYGEQREMAVHRFKDDIEEQSDRDQARNLGDGRDEFFCGTNLPRAKNSVNAAVSTRSKKRKPAILVLKRSDASADRFMIPAALIRFLLMRAVESAVHPNGAGFRFRDQRY